MFHSLAQRKPELFNFDNAEEIFETFRKIHPLLKEEYFLETSESDEDHEYESNQMSGLIISKGGVYSFFSYREIAEYRTFWASGSGMEYVLGALEASYATRKGPKAAAEAAIKIACKFDNGSGVPLESYELEIET